MSTIYRWACACPPERGNVKEITSTFAGSPAESEARMLKGLLDDGKCSQCAQPIVYSERETEKIGVAVDEPATAMIVDEPYDTRGTPGRACLVCHSAWPASEPDAEPWHHADECPLGTPRAPEAVQNVAPPPEVYLVRHLGFVVRAVSSGEEARGVVRDIRTIDDGCTGKIVPTDQDIVGPYILSPERHST